MLISAFAVGLAVVEAFLVPLRVGTVPLPICVLLAVAGNVVLTKLAVRQTGSIVCGVLQPVLWLLVIVVLSLPRAEGDLIVPGSADRAGVPVRRRGRRRVRRRVRDHPSGRGGRPYPAVVSGEMDTASGQPT